MSPWAARLYLVLGAVAIALRFVLPPIGDEAVYGAIAVSAFAAGVVGLRGNRPAPRLAWLLVLASLLSWAAGDLAFLFHGTRDVWPVADAFYLGGYPLFGAGLVLFVRRAAGERMPWLETVILTIGVVPVAWPLLLEPQLASGTVYARAVALSYPLFDLGLLAVLAGLARVRASASVGLLELALATTLAGDVSLVAPALDGTWTPGTWRDVCWLAGYLAAGAAMLHPSVGTAPAAARAPARVLTVRRGLVLGGALLATPLGLLLDTTVTTVDRSLFAAAGLGIVSLVALRFVLLARQFESLRERAERSERRFRTVFESAGLGISIGANGLMSETNPAYQAFLGYTGEELAEMHFGMVTVPDDPEPELPGPDGARRFERRYIRKDGGEVWGRVTVTRAPDGQFGIAVIEDVSERRLLEQQLQQAQKMEAVGQLAGGVAHDFNNLIMGVRGYADILLAELDEADPRRTRAEAIVAAADRAAGLTRQLLAFGRRQMLRPERVELATVLAGLQPMLRRLIRADVELELSLAGDVVVHADRTQLEQVVVNLVLNARDALPQGGRIGILLSTREVTAGEAPFAGVDPGLYADLRVTDDGTGMDEETRARVFEPFFTTKPNGDGTGLGLATAYGIAAQSGGTILVASEPRLGSTFTVLLPLTRDETAPEPASADPLPAGATGGTVLLAEDDDRVRLVVAEMLERRGYRVLAACGGAEALALADAHAGPIDVLVTDVVMRGLNGRGLARTLQERRGPLPVVFCSGYTAEALGANDLIDPHTVLLTKPFQVDELLAAIEATRTGTAERQLMPRG